MGEKITSATYNFSLTTSLKYQQAVFFEENVWKKLTFKQAHFNPSPSHNSSSSSYSSSITVKPQKKEEARLSSVVQQPVVSPAQQIHKPAPPKKVVSNQQPSKYLTDSILNTSKSSNFSEPSKTVSNSSQSSSIGENSGNPTRYSGPAANPSQIFIDNIASNLTSRGPPQTEIVTLTTSAFKKKQNEGAQVATTSSNNSLNSSSSTLSHNTEVNTTHPPSTYLDKKTKSEDEAVMQQLENIFSNLERESVEATSEIKKENEALKKEVKDMSEKLSLLMAMFQQQSQAKKQ